MSDVISSAGLVYVYLNRYEEDGFSIIESIDSYRYMNEAFLNQVKEKIKITPKDDNSTHVFAILGTKEKVTIVYNLLEKELRENFRRILARKNIQKSSRSLDPIGNAFFRCVQEFFCEQLDHFPKRIFNDYGDLVFSGICYNHLAESISDAMTNEIITSWLEQEDPCLCGKQVVIRSFFFRDFIGRKVIACIPQRKIGTWSLVFEGGHQLSMEPELSYTKETVHPNELGSFSSSNLQTILMNPIYAYGMWFYPNDLCEEWHKAFLYLCAISEYTWDKDSISKVYEKFLNFLQNNICETMEASPIISKEEHHSVLLRHIENFRSFLKGEDEPVISKDLHQTMNSRYVYLPYLRSLVPHHEIINNFSPSVLHKMVKKALNSNDTYKKGLLFEDAVAYVLENIPGWKIAGRRIRAGSQEIDISVVNISLDDDLWQLGAYLLVECKNWQKPVDLHQVRNIAHISNMKGNKTAILFAAHGITKDASKEINRLLAEHLSVICITANDLLQIQKVSDCRNLILTKWQMIQNTIDITSMI